MPKKRTFYSEEERKAHHEKKQREADLQIQELTKHWENDPKDIAEYLAFSTQFYKYSSRNTMLIYRQRPDSVFIASYTHWKELGYYVQEGEHGANIYRPETTRYFKPNVPNPTWVLLSKASPEQRHEVEIGMLESRDFTYFKPCTVFDISQTNCPPEDYPKLCGVGYNSTQHKDIYNTLCLYSEEIGVPVSEEDFEGIGTRGAYNPRNKHIHINQLLGDTQKLDTLLHEMSHHLMGHSHNIEKPTMQREFEADGLSIAKACRDLNVSREQLNNMIHKFRKNGMQISIIQASDIIKLPLNKNTEEAVYQYIVDHNYSISSRQMRTDLSLTKQQTKSFLQKFRRKGIEITVVESKKRNSDAQPQ